MIHLYRLVSGIWKSVTHTDVTPPLPPVGAGGFGTGGFGTSGFGI